MNDIKSGVLCGKSLPVLEFAHKEAWHRAKGEALEVGATKNETAERCCRAEDASSGAISATNLFGRFHKMGCGKINGSTHRCARFDVGRGRIGYRGRRREGCYWIKVSGIVAMVINARFCLLQIRTHVMHDLRCIVRNATLL